MTTNQNQTIAEFINNNGVTMTWSRIAINRNMEGSENMDNWSCTLFLARRQMTVPFSMGRGHNGCPPSRADVLNCLASDASVDGMTFEDFCLEFGYDEDSRKAFRTFRACQRATDNLKKFLGEDLFSELLSCERL